MPTNLKCHATTLTIWEEVLLVGTSYPYIFLIYKCICYLTTGKKSDKYTIPINNNHHHATLTIWEVLCTSWQRVTVLIIPTFSQSTTLSYLTAVKRGINMQLPLTTTNRHGTLTIWEVLLIGKDQDDGVPHLAVVDDAVKLLSRLIHAVPVGAVHHKDEPLGACVVMSPQRPYLVLPTHVLQGRCVCQVAGNGMIKGECISLSLSLYCSL